MNRWVGKVAVVTGASSGIGAAIVVDLVKAGVIVVGLARRVQRVEELRNKITLLESGKLYAVQCDVTKEEDIKKSFEWIETKLGGVDILVNNAGIIRQTNLLSPDNTVAIKEILDTNVMGVVLCTREAFKSMKKRSVDGHIVIINSIIGHKVPYFGGELPCTNMYPSSKFAVTAMTEVLRQELQMEGTKRTKITVLYLKKNPTQ